MSVVGRILLSFVLLQAVPPALAASASAPTGVTAPPAPAGFWVSDDGDWVIEITFCATGICGRLVGLKQSAKPNALRMDIHNPDPAMRGTPLCGLVLMASLKPVPGEAGKWDDGSIYDPYKGKTYSARIGLDGPDRLRVRGYVLLSLFGRSETLTRETGPVNRCADKP
jgi:uncharacterized protein (DUF2147 family)